MHRHRIEMSASIIFDLVMPEDATEQEIKSQAAINYETAVDRRGGFTLWCELPDCRVYVDTVDGLKPAYIEIVDTETFNENEDEIHNASTER